MKKPKSHLFTILQGKDESLKDYLTHFNTEALQIEGCTDDLAMSTMMAGLMPTKLLWSIGKNNPKNF